MTALDDLYRLGHHPAFAAGAGDEALDDHGKAFLAAIPAEGRDELGPVDVAALDAIHTALDEAPAITVGAIARALEGDAVSEDEVRRLLEDARTALRDPQRAVDWLSASAEAVPKVPFTAPFPGRDDNAIEIDTSIVRYEERRDWWGWVTNAGKYWARGKVGRTVKSPFRYAVDYPSLFVYDTPMPSGGFRVALLSDFGTGLYTSKYIAKHVREHARPNMVAHLGDVYYSGRPSDFERGFRSVLQPIIETTPMYALNANHEMLSGGWSYFGYLDYKREQAPQLQRQEGSYFSVLVGDRYQIVGIDTAWHEDGRHSHGELNYWLEHRLRDGRNAGRINILLSPNPPYGLGASRPNALLRDDLAPLVADRLVDLWLWGDTHYHALYQRGGHSPFIGCCIGHGGFPYKKKSASSADGMLTRVRFLDTGTRFPEETRIRADMGNNGYVVLTLRDDGVVELESTDWMRRTRHTARLGTSSVTGQFDVIG